MSSISPVDLEISSVWIFVSLLNVQASNAYSTVEQNVFLLYEQNGKQLQEKLQELFATLDRIANLEQELEQFRVSLGALYKEVNWRCQRLILQGICDKYQLVEHCLPS